MFADQVVAQFADHFVSRKPKTNESTAIRVTFRKLGGSWFALCAGDIRHLMLLGQVVKAWGQRQD